MTITYNAPKVAEQLGLFPISKEINSLILSDPGIYTITGTHPWFLGTSDSDPAPTAIAAGAAKTVTVASDPTTIWVNLSDIEAGATLSISFTPSGVDAHGNVEGLPTGGTDGQALLKVSGVAQWADLPSGVPTPPTEGRYSLQVAGGEIVWDVDNTIFTFNQLGAGYGLYNGKTNGVGQLRTIKAGSGCTLSVDGDGSLVISVP